MLVDKFVRYIIRQLAKDRSAKAVAEEMKVSQRHVRRLWAEYLKTGTVHVQGRARRPKGADPSDAEAGWCQTPANPIIHHLCNGGWRMEP